MINVYDIAYALAVGVSSPLWLTRTPTRKKVFKAFRERLGRELPTRETSRPAVLIHAVSLGETNATRGLVTGLLSRRPELHVIVSSTTETGYARAMELYGPTSQLGAQHAGRLLVIHYPLDFSSAIVRVLDGVRPSLVVLMELEVWPNFMRQCHKRSIPVLVVNGRMTEPSFRKYRRMKRLISPMFRRLAHACVQDETNRQRFAALGLDASRISITGTMKFDTATVADRVPGDEALARDLHLRPKFLDASGAEPIWLCGSTGPGEEQIVLDAYRALLAAVPGLRLIIVPRHPQRFDEVAKLIESAGFSLVRRSKLRGEPSSSSNAVILGDTMGELRKFYSLADVVFVGRTLVDLGPRQHGSDMIEPAALGKPVIVGPFTGNFADAMSRFRESEAMVEVESREALERAVREFLESPRTAQEIGARARDVVVKHQGVTERHLEVILRFADAAMPQR